jgi:5-methylcytosine-specific restriction endonuclease McrA
MSTHTPLIPSPAAASSHAPATPSLELLEARQARDGLAALLRAERSAAADFLLALSAFDRHRGWEPLGHASLFAFLHVELGLSKGGAFFRQTAARLLQRFPEIIEPLRDGRLCITTVVELARVLTEANRAEVLPRFYGCSSQEAKEVVAALLPMASPSVRAVVTAVAVRKVAVPARTVEAAASLLGMLPMAAPAVVTAVLVQSTEPTGTHPARGVERRNEVSPLTADLRRLHITVGRQFLKKLDAARDGLSHNIRNPSTEQVLEAALDLLLEKQAKARGQVKRPRTTLPASSPEQTMAAPTIQQPPAWNSSVARPEGRATERRHRRPGPREQIPAAVRRAVWERDGGRCSWPLDGGGVCGSTHRLELDHIVPWARWSGSKVDDLRVVCHQHNALAARQAFGELTMARYGRSKAGDA